MIQLSRNYSLPEQHDESIPIKVVGIGGAGSNALDRIILDGLEKAELLAANTDVQSLASSVASQKVQLGRTTTRGLGAGGDPEIGRAAAIEAADELRDALSDARMIFVCAGLGGGTGSGSAPVIAELARENGALVISFATMPFEFEGKRRTVQALEALEQLQHFSNAVICFENDKMGDMVAPKAGIHQAFAAADVTISQSVRAIVNLIQRPGLLRIGFDELLAALNNPNARCLFGFGESDSDNRAHEALAQALKNPLMDRGRLLGDAANVLVQVAGGPGMTLSEVEVLMHELGRHVGDETQILFGTAVDGRMGNRLSVTLISSLAADVPMLVAPVKTPAAERPVPPVSRQPAVNPAPQIAPQPQMDSEAAEKSVAKMEQEELPAYELQPEEIPPPVPPPRSLQSIEASLAPAEAPIPPAREEQGVPPQTEDLPATASEDAEEHPPQPRLILPKKKLTPPREPKAPVEKIVARQEVLQFESVTRGRFEKSEPTIVEGQDLDVPTFLRKNVKVK